MSDGVDIERRSGQDRRREEDPLVKAARELIALSISEELDAIRLSQGLTLERMAEIADVDHKTVMRLMNLSTDWRFSTLVKCAKAVGYEVDIRLRPASLKRG